MATRPARIEPEGIMENFDALRTDTEGHPHYRLTARKLKHYSNSKRTELDSPRFIQMDPQSGEVTAVAQQATVSPDGSEVDLRGEVEVLRAARPGQSAMSLHTARLVIFPERDMLHSPGHGGRQDATLKLHAGGHGIQRQATRHQTDRTGESPLFFRKAIAPCKH